MAGSENCFDATGSVEYTFAVGFRNAYGATATNARYAFISGPYRALAGSTGTLDYAIAIGYEAGFNTTYNSPALFGKDSQPGAHAQVVLGSSYYTGGVVVDGKNFGINQKTFGTNADKVLGHALGTAPTTSPADCYQLWAADIAGAADKCGAHIRNENTNTLIVAGVLRKTDTGDPAYNHEALMCINEFDNNVKIYADGGWRTLATW